MINPGVTYYHTVDLSEFTPTTSETGEPIWAHHDGKNLTVYSYDDMTGFYDAFMLMNETQYEKFLIESHEISDKLLDEKLEDLMGRHCMIYTSLGEEYWFKLEAIDHTSCAFIASKLAYKTPEMKEMSLEYGMIFFTYLFMEEFRAMTGQEIDKMFDKNNDDAKKAGGLIDDLLSMSNIATMGMNKDTSTKHLPNNNSAKKEDKGVEAVKLPRDYQPSLVNATMCPTDLSKKLKIALGKENRPDAITVIMSGPPGVGKTLAAKYVANELGKELKVFQLGQLVNKYVGETEKAIMNAFKEATEEGHIILIDEFDSITVDRDETDRNHQVQMVNSVLQAIDSFNGIAFFTTNSTDRMDSAVKRRMLLEIEFKNLKVQQANEFSKIFFPNHKVQLTGNEKFAPADFAKVRDGLLFVEDNDITADYLTEKLKKAAKSRNKSEKHHDIYKRIKATGPIGFNFKKEDN